MKDRISDREITRAIHSYIDKLEKQVPTRQRPKGFLPGSTINVMEQVRRGLIFAMRRPPEVLPERVGEDVRHQLWSYKMLQRVEDKLLIQSAHWVELGLKAFPGTRPLDAKDGVRMGLLRRMMGSHRT